MDKGNKIIEGKTKIIYQAKDNSKQVLICSKDSITAGNGLKKDELPGKAKYSTTTTCNVFRLLHLSHIPTHFIRQESADTFRALKCSMVPLEVIVRRIATGSYLKRHPETTQGTIFDPVVLEFTYKDDSLGDPLISEQEIIQRHMQCGPLLVDSSVLTMIKAMARKSFEILEKAWKKLDVVLVDFKVEFGVTSDGNLIVADVVDNDSWRIWPKGDPKLMKDKQVYRNISGPLSDQQKESLVQNYSWVAEQPLVDSLIEPLENPNSPLVAVIMGSQSDWETMKHAASTLEVLGIPHESRIVSAHRTPERMYAFAKSAKSKGFKVIIAGAGGAAHLPGMVAALTTLPVLGVPVQSKALKGMDSILSIAQMPGGVPVGTLAIGTSGAINAALLAASILASCGSYPEITTALEKFREKQTEGVAEFPEMKSSHETIVTNLPIPTQTIDQPLPTGSTIGIIGGGQLAKMITQAATTLGYKTHVYCPDKLSPSFQVTDSHTVGEYTDKKSLALFAANVDVITYEFENIPTETIEYVSQFVPVRPSSKILATCQNRIREKQFVNQAGIATTKYSEVHSFEELSKAIEQIGYPAVLKTNTMGYDGKGQIIIRTGDHLSAVWEKMEKEMKSTDTILEAFVEFTAEVSVIVCRGLFGTIATYPIVENHHENHILRETIAPAPVSEDVRKKGEEIAVKLATAMDLVGVLAVEMFLTKDNSLLVNELAPRPHNSGHWTIEGSVTSQFEQLVRAICGLPLGSTKMTAKKVVMKNLLGNEISTWQKYLTLPNTYVHVYGKKEAKPERKMGHFTTLLEKE